MQNRRDFIRAAGLTGLGLAGGLASCAPSPWSHKGQMASRFPKPLIAKDRIIKETVGLRPFRPTGFRLACETLDKKTIVHNYGHGGSGWSLSWGTANMAVQMALATGEQQYAVLGCGVVGVATARLLQRAGKQVTIYTKDLPPLVTSSMATGTWSPSYTLVEAEHITPQFRETWLKARAFSYQVFQNSLGLNNNPITWMDQYTVRDSLGERKSLLDEADLVPKPELLSKKDHPFKAAYVTKQASLVFNIPSYLARQTDEFLAYGGEVKIKHFTSLEELDALPERCIMNCTGLGSHALFNDAELMPVAGQLTFLVPQPEYQYRLNAPGGYAIPRRDAIVLGGNSLKGIWDTTPNKEQTEKVIHALQQVVNDMRV